MDPRLVTYKGETVDLVFVLNENRVTLGRASDNIIQLSDKQISKHHALIYFKRGAWHLEDLDSSNGCTVNDKPASKVKLQHGDRIGIGHTTLVLETSPNQGVPSHVVDISPDAYAQTLIERKK